MKNNIILLSGDHDRGLFRKPYIDKVLDKQIKKFENDWQKEGFSKFGSKYLLLTCIIVIKRINLMLRHNLFNPYQDREQYLDKRNYFRSCYKLMNS